VDIKGTLTDFNPCTNSVAEIKNIQREKLKMAIDRLNWSDHKSRRVALSITNRFIAII
jgi:hypothetical protein